MEEIVFSSDMALLTHLKVQMAKWTLILSGNVTCSYCAIAE